MDRRAPAARGVFRGLSGAESPVGGGAAGARTVGEGRRKNQNALLHLTADLGVEGGAAFRDGARPRRDGGDFSVRGEVLRGYSVARGVCRSSVRSAGARGTGELRSGGAGAAIAGESEAGGRTDFSGAAGGVCGVCARAAGGGGGGALSERRNPRGAAGGESAAECAVPENGRGGRGVGRAHVERDDVDALCARGHPGRDRLPGELADLSFGQNAREDRVSRHRKSLVEGADVSRIYPRGRASRRAGGSASRVPV